MNDVATLMRDKEVQKLLIQETVLLDKINEYETKNYELRQNVANNALNFEKETISRQELSDKQRINPNYRRLRFLGEPKEYD